MKKNLLLSTEKNIFKSKWTMRILSLAIIAAVMFSTISMGALPVFATGTAAANTNVDLPQLMGKIIGIILDIFFYVGIVMLVWAIAQTGLAFKNDDPDSKQRATMLLVISAILIGLRPIVKGIVDTFGGAIVFN